MGLTILALGIEWLENFCRIFFKIAGFLCCPVADNDNKLYERTVVIRRDFRARLDKLRLRLRLIRRWSRNRKNNRFNPRPLFGAHVHEGINSCKRISTVGSMGARKEVYKFTNLRGGCGAHSFFSGGKSWRGSVISNSRINWKRIPTVDSSAPFGSHESVLGLFSHRNFCEKCCTYSRSNFHRSRKASSSIVCIWLSINCLYKKKKNLCKNIPKGSIQLGKKQVLSINLGSVFLVAFHTFSQGRTQEQF